MSRLLRYFLAGRPFRHLSTTGAQLMTVGNGLPWPRAMLLTTWLPILHELPPHAKLLLKATVLLSYLAWVGELRVGKFAGQWRAYLRRPYYLLAVSLLWGLLELTSAHLGT
ncbi:MAG: hypothetical protein ACRYFZ_26395 [Janthinobacterium lividum]